MTTLQVDYENNAEEWWDGTEERIESFPAETRQLIVGDVDEITVSTAVADAFVAVAESIPGWDNGPEYAPTAIVRHDD